jgi:hypothetical protein
MKERMKETLVAVIKCKTSQRLLTGNVFPSPFIQLACVLWMCPDGQAAISQKGGKNAIHLRNCEIVQQQQQQQEEELFCASCWTFDRSPSSQKRGEAAEEKKRQDERTRSFEIEQQQ